MTRLLSGWRIALALHLNGAIYRIIITYSYHNIAQPFISDYTVINGPNSTIQTNFLIIRPILHNILPLSVVVTLLLNVYVKLWYQIMWNRDLKFISSSRSVNGYQSG